jgi:hypothetical protein
MRPQAVADELRHLIKAPPGAITVWPWHDDDGRITMIVVIDPAIWIDTSQIPVEYQGFKVKIERRPPPIVQRAS